MAGIGFGVAFLRDSNTLAGAAAIGFGVAGIGGGMAFLRDSNTLAGAALIGYGVAAIGLGTADLRDSNTLLGAAGIVLGAAAIGLGVVALRHGGAISRIRSGLATLTREPAAPNPADTPTTVDQPTAEARGLDRSHTPQKGAN